MEKRVLMLSDCQAASLKLLIASASLTSWRNVTVALSPFVNVLCYPVLCMRFWPRSPTSEGMSEFVTNRLTVVAERRLQLGWCRRYIVNMGLNLLYRESSRSDAWAMNKEVKNRRRRRPQFVRSAHEERKTATNHYADVEESPILWNRGWQVCRRFRMSDIDERRRVTMRPVLLWFMYDIRLFLLRHSGGGRGSISCP